LKVDFRLQNYLHFSSTKDPSTTQVAAVAHNEQGLQKYRHSVFCRLVFIQK
jgi:hypothetical protein